jgi:hypothetical protein
MPCGTPLPLRERTRAKRAGEGSLSPRVHHRNPRASAICGAIQTPSEDVVLRLPTKSLRPRDPCSAERRYSSIAKRDNPEIRASGYAPDHIRSVRGADSIHFDNQLALEAHEVGDVAAKWDLSLELEAIQTARSQLRPKFSLGVRLPAAQRSSASGCHRVGAPSRISSLHPRSVRSRKGGCFCLAANVWRRTRLRVLLGCGGTSGDTATPHSLASLASSPARGEGMKRRRSRRDQSNVRR